MTRGLKLRNPFNLESNKDILWNGEKIPSSDPVFCEFEDDLHGIRAGYRNLYHNWLDNYNTVSLIITKYAPPSENNTKAYINNVCKALNVQPNDIIDLSKFEVIKPFGLAIIKQEQSCQPYTDELINQALAMLKILPSA